MMQTSSVNQVSRSKDVGRYLLGEYSLSSFLPNAEKDDRETVELLFKTMREMDIPLEILEPVEAAMRSFAREGLVQTQPGREDSTVQIRIYCQKKITDEEIKRGWGYFVIERPKEAYPQDGTEIQHMIDFYIYEEGP